VKNICAWCKKELEDNSEPANNSKYEITHGICLSCKEYFFSDQTYSLDSFLNRLQEPVMMVDEQGNVLLANDHAKQILKMDNSAVSNLKIGNVFECANARLPGGCGHSVHCVACTIRSNINNTFKTGLSLKQVPAVLNHTDGRDARQVDFLISTEKVDNVVLLRIDDILDKKDLYNETRNKVCQLEDSE
jgi:transcriptional regulator with PAS, ATPase and Fis domain